MNKLFLFFLDAVLQILISKSRQRSATKFNLNCPMNSLFVTPHKLCEPNATDANEIYCQQPSEQLVRTGCHVKIENFHTLSAVHHELNPPQVKLSRLGFWSIFNETLSSQSFVIVSRLAELLLTKNTMKIFQGLASQLDSQK